MLQKNTELFNSRFLELIQTFYKKNHYHIKTKPVRLTGRLK